MFIAVALGGNAFATVSVEPKSARENAELRAQCAVSIFESTVVPGASSIPLERMFEAVGIANPKPRTYRMIARMDPNKDGAITKDEAIEGMHGIVGYQIDWTMGLDGDGDGTLSMTEYALGYADPDSPRNEEGFTEDQIASFKRYDLNSDGSLTREEIDTDYSRYYVRLFRAWRLTGQLGELDGWSEGLTVRDFATLVGIPDTEPIPEAMEKSFSYFTDAGLRIPLQTVGARLAQLELDEYEAIERSVRSSIDSKEDQ